MNKTILTAICAVCALSSGTVRTAQPNDGLVAFDSDARSIAQQLVKQLSERLRQVMQQSGPVQAISVCWDEAPKITRNLSLKHGMKVTRIGTRVRNNLLGTPDSWEQSQLNSFERRKADGEAWDDMTVSAVTEENGKRYYRFMKALGTKPLCQTCHGDDETVPQLVRDVLQLAYPHDRARGYSAGDLRGAVSIKKLLDAEH